MKTAVEWLIEEHFGGIENCSPDFRQRIEQAKAMEKEQIIDAYCEKMGMMHNEKWAEMINEQAEQYYNETYKTDKL